MYHTRVATTVLLRKLFDILLFYIFNLLMTTFSYHRQKRLSWQCQGLVGLTNDKSHHSVEINGKLLFSDLLTDLVGDIRGQNFHECFTSKLSHQIVLKKK